MILEKPALVTFASPEYRELALLTGPSKFLYAHKYDYVYHYDIYRGPIHRVGFERLALVLKMLEDGHRAVIWMDADAMITNDRICILSEIESRRAPADRHLFCSADMHGLNSGIFVAFNTDLMKQFLYVITHAYGEQHFGTHPWGEQAAMIHLLAAPPYHNLATYLPQRSLNAYAREALTAFPDYVTRDGIWQTGDWAIQFAGLPMVERLRLAHLYRTRLS